MFNSTYSRIQNQWIRLNKYNILFTIYYILFTIYYLLYTIYHILSTKYRSILSLNFSNHSCQLKKKTDRKINSLSLASHLFFANGLRVGVFALTKAQFHLPLGQALPKSIVDLVGTWSHYHHVRLLGQVPKKRLNHPSWADLRKYWGKTHVTVFEKL